LARALEKPSERLIVEFSGVCNELVVLNRNGVTLRGVGEQPTIEGAISIPGAIQIRLEDLKVINSPGSGIEALEGAAVTLRNILVDTTGDRGINIRNSNAELADIRVERAGNVGIVVRGSDVLIQGTLVANDNPRAGLSVTESSSAFIRNADLELKGNDLGLIVQLASSVAFVDGSLRANENVLAGLFISSFGAFSYERIQLEANDNGFLGFWLNQFGSLASFSSTAPPTLLSGNGLAGALVEKRSFLELNANTLISENLFGGLLVSESSIQLTEVTLQDNAVLDISMRFGAQATFFGGNVVGTPIDCDATVLTRGPLGCASPLTDGGESAQQQWPPLPRSEARAGFLPAAGPLHTLREQMRQLRMEERGQ
jgi:hypothetical protein